MIYKSFLVSIIKIRNRNLWDEILTEAWISELKRNGQKIRVVKHLKQIKSERKHRRAFLIISVKRNEMQIGSSLHFALGAVNLRNYLKNEKDYILH